MHRSTMRMRAGRGGRFLAVFSLCLGVQVGSLWLSGGFRAEFGAHPDEPSHFITGLMVRDYLAAGAPSGAMRFAENYYVHYPKVALGHYPPLLYIVEAAWMLVFPPWRISLLLLEALLLATSATLLYFSVRRESGALALVAVPILLILTPVVQYCAGMVMQEVLCLLLAIAAVLWWSRYLESQRWQHAAWFGVAASLAILTKQVALFLALVPPLTVVLTRRFGLLRRVHFWIPAPVVLALSLPWYLYAHTLTVKPVRYLAGTYLGIPSLSAQVSDLAATSGLALLLAAALGVWVSVVWPALRGKPVERNWATWTALVAGFLLFRFMATAAFEARHLIYIQPAVVAFAVAGTGWLLRRSGQAWLTLTKRTLVAALVAGLAFNIWASATSRQRYAGFSEAARALLSDERFRHAGFLVCSDASGEGAFIAEVAVREARPGHIVLRANKMLAKMSWSGNIYQLLYGTPEEVQEYLEGIPVAVLVLDLTPAPTWTEHHKLVEAVVNRYADRWRLIGVYPRERPRSPDGAEVRAYALAGYESKPAGEVRVDLTEQLNKFVEN
jgi:hypothetical protein